MVNNLSINIEAVKETVSDALNRVTKSSEILRDDIADLDDKFERIQATSNMTKESLNKLKREEDNLRDATLEADRAMETIESTMDELQSGSISTAEAEDRLSNASEKLARAQRTADAAGESLEDTIDSVATSSAISSEAEDRLESIRRRLTGATFAYDNTLEDVNRSEMQSVIATLASAEALDKKDRSLGRVNRSMAVANTQMGIMETLAESSSLEFGSLSLNIGSFNIALKQLHVQLPAIIAGMGALLSVVVALAAAFTALIGATGIFLASGLAAFVGDVEKNFEDIENRTEALMAVMGAFADAVGDALAPLMDGSGQQAFLGFLQGIIDSINVIAQWVDQNMDEFTSFWSDVDFDLEDFLNALMEVFREMRPFLLDVIHFFTKNLPDALRAFGDAAQEIIPPLQQMFSMLRGLFFELIDVAGLILSAIAPVVAGLIALFDVFFTVINALDDRMLKTIGTFIFAALAFSRVTTGVIGLFGALSTLTDALLSAAFSGNTLAQSLLTIRNMSWLAASGKIADAEATDIMSDAYDEAKGSLRELIATKIKGIKTTITRIGRSAALVASYIAEGLAAKFAELSTWGLVVAVSALTGGAYILVAALGILVSGLIQGKGAMGALGESLSFVYDGFRAIALTIWEFIKALVMLIVGPIIAFIEGLQEVAAALLGVEKGAEDASGAFDTLFDAVMLILSPFMLFIDILTVAMQILRNVSEIMQGGVFHELASAIRGVSAWLGRILGQFDILRKSANAVKDIFWALLNPLEAMDKMWGAIVNQINRIPGMDIEGPNVDARTRQETEDEGDEEDDFAAREPNVELNLEDRVEQNIEVDADPEERETMRRVVKDALNEANSVARRSDGHPR